MIPELERALNALSQRQRVVADNLANINTPGYTRSDTDFYQYMESVFAGSTADPATRFDLDSPERLDGNNVTLEREMFALSQTELLYTAVNRLTTEDIQHLRYAITEGRG